MDFLAPRQGRPAYDKSVVAASSEVTSLDSGACSFDFMLESPLVDGPYKSGQKQAGKQKSEKVAHNAPRSLPCRCCDRESGSAFDNRERKAVPKNLVRVLTDNHAGEVVVSDNVTPLTKSDGRRSEAHKYEHCARFHDEAEINYLITLQKRKL